jgi:starch synthase (maltosyl-transferring)
VHDVLGEGRFLWQGGSNYVDLDPGVLPAHIFRIRRRTKTEHDFEYFA